MPVEYSPSRREFLRKSANVALVTVGALAGLDASVDIAGAIDDKRDGDRLQRKGLGQIGQNDRAAGRNLRAAQTHLDNVGSEAGAGVAAGIVGLIAARFGLNNLIGSE